MEHESLSKKIAYGGGLFTKKGFEKPSPCPDKIPAPEPYKTGGGSRRTSQGIRGFFKKTCCFVHLATRLWPRGTDRAALRGKSRCNMRASGASCADEEAVRVRIRRVASDANTDCDANEVEKEALFKLKQKLK